MVLALVGSDRSSEIYCVFDVLSKANRGFWHLLKGMAWRSQLSKNLKELRILFCQTSPASSHTREFVEKNYKVLKTENPKLPILIREAHGVEPQLWARYDFGFEKGIRLEGMTEPQIFKALEDLVKAGAALKA
ncbi:hypothetical protein Drorol1_Dr00006608 [Drosera rotundifolia]